MAQALRIISGTGIEYAMLLLIRVFALVFASPIFGRQNIPRNVRVAYGLALTYFFFTAVPPQYAPAVSGGIPAFVLLCAMELLLGVVMGYILTLFFSAAFVAGQLIDMQIGFGMANVYDPNSNASVPLLGNMLNIMMMIVFFAVDGHQQLISIMYIALLRIPIGSVMLNEQLPLAIMQMFSSAFVLGIRIALPIVAAGLVAEAVLGMVIRTVPQMNVFVIGMPLKVLIGFLVLVMVLPVYAYFTANIFELMFESIDEAFAVLAL